MEAVFGHEMHSNWANWPPAQTNKQLHIWLYKSIGPIIFGEENEVRGKTGIMEAIEEQV